MSVTKILSREHFRGITAAWEWITDEIRLAADGDIRGGSHPSEGRLNLSRVVRSDQQRVRSTVATMRCTSRRPEDRHVRQYLITHAMTDHIIDIVDSIYAHRHNGDAFGARDYPLQLQLQQVTTRRGAERPEPRRAGKRTFIAVSAFSTNTSARDLGRTSPSHYRSTE
jgi:hypothetical protein